MTTVLAQLTDLHVCEPGSLSEGRFDTAHALRVAVETVLGLTTPPAALVLTGDLVDRGDAAEYDHLRVLIAPLALPLWLMPGNHDDRDALRQAFPEHGYLGRDGFIQYAAEIAGAGGPVLICLDTVEPGEDLGRLCRKRLRWLRDELARWAGRSVIVAMHHPPFRTGIGHMDEIGLAEGAVELAAMLRAAANVERVICGHLHRSMFARFGGTVASTAPSPAQQVALDLRAEADAAWTLEPAGLHLHAWLGPGELVTHSAPIGRFPGPYPFADTRT